MSRIVSNAPVICDARIAAPISMMSLTSAEIGAMVCGAASAKVTVSRGSPARFLLTATVQSAAATKAATAVSPSCVSTAMCSASLAKGTARTLPSRRPLALSATLSLSTAGATVMAPSGALSPARPSNQVACKVSASATGTAWAPAARRMAKPSASEPPAPPRSSPSQALVSPDSSSAFHSGARQLSSEAALRACGLARS